MSGRFLVRRIAQTIPLLLIVSLLIFALIHAAPGGPLALYLENRTCARRTSMVASQRGLDRPLPAQYLSAVGVVRGDCYSYAEAAGADGC